jgi:hypothetical protein
MIGAEQQAKNSWQDRWQNGRTAEGTAKKI